MSNAEDLQMKSIKAIFENIIDPMYEGIDRRAKLRARPVPAKPLEGEAHMTGLFYWMNKRLAGQDVRHPFNGWVPHKDQRGNVPTDLRSVDEDRFAAEFIDPSNGKRYRMDVYEVEPRASADVFDLSGSPVSLSRTSQDGGA